jgi:distribution and morphology protein 12
MSIEINWDTLTTGSDGEALAETIRAFIHDRFQQIALPRMIRSVKCHAFEFGNVAPTVELKDVCDPLPDFYENDADDSQDDDETPGQIDENQHSIATPRVDETRPHYQHNASLSRDEFHHSRLTNSREHIGNPILSTPGVLGGTSNLGYFHLPLSAGLSGTTTPLAAVAGAQFHNARHGPSQLAQSPESNYSDNEPRHRSTSFGSSSKSSSRPTSKHMDWPDKSLHHDEDDSDTSRHGAGDEQERSPEDVQMVFHVAYCGDVKLRLTAEISLDYPMPSFVGIPLQLNITGLTFDGVGILAYIKKKAHFCFLCQEDAESLVGGSLTGEHEEHSADSPKSSRKLGALLEEIKVESEIGQREGGKQVLKNVGKVEKFVLEQVRRIFDDEFVYPSFWTFLV